MPTTTAARNPAKHRNLSARSGITVTGEASTSTGGGGGSAAAAALRMRMAVLPPQSKHSVPMTSHWLQPEQCPRPELQRVHVNAGSGIRLPHDGQSLSGTS